MLQKPAPSGSPVRQQKSRGPHFLCTPRPIPCPQAHSSSFRPLRSHLFSSLSLVPSLDLCSPFIPSFCFYRLHSAGQATGLAFKRKTIPAKTRSRQAGSKIKKKLGRKRQKLQACHNLKSGGEMGGGEHTRVRNGLFLKNRGSIPESHFPIPTQHHRTLWSSPTTGSEEPPNQSQRVPLKGHLVGYSQASGQRSTEEL